MALKALRLAGINTLQDCAKMAQDVQQFTDQVYTQCPATLDAPPSAGQIGFLVQEDDGTWHLWTLAAGAGITLTADTVTRTLTVMSP